jgi:hypothetical protein
VLAGERLGAGILMDGRLVRGRAGGAGEMSYLYLTEGVNDAHGIAAGARELGERAVAQGWAAPEPGQVTAETVLNAASAGDEVAMDIVDRLGRRFARVAATLDLLLDPDLLVFGGAVAQAGEVFLPAIQRHLPAALEPEFDAVIAFCLVSGVSWNAFVPTPTRCSGCGEVGPRSAVDEGPGPGAGVDAERAEDVLLQLGAAGDGGDGLFAGGEGDLADPVELL